MDMITDDLLNEPQRRKLTSTLRMLEKDLRQVDAWLQITEETGLLYRRSLRLSPERRVAARQHIAAALQQIGELAAKFNLASQDENLTATINAMMRLDGIDLGETYANQLKGSGAVDPRLRPALDPHLDRLARLVSLLPGIVSGEPSE
jgi:hypothetical protein